MQLFMEIWASSLQGALAIILNLTPDVWLGPPWLKTPIIYPWRVHRWNWSLTVFRSVFPCKSFKGLFILGQLLDTRTRSLKEPGCFSSSKLLPILMAKCQEEKTEIVKHQLRSLKKEAVNVDHFLLSLHLTFLKLSWFVLETGYFPSAAGGRRGRMYS